MPSSQANIHLCNCADEAVQNALINTHPNFFTTNPDKLFDMVEVLVTQWSNPIVHRLAFASSMSNLCSKSQRLFSFFTHVCLLV